MAPSANDSLRRTLDTFSVPKEASDRPYLESVLRRLGYTEAEIAAYLGDAAPAAAPREPEPPAQPTERVVEVEYTGPGLREFRIAQPVTAEEYALAQAESGPAIEVEAGPSLEEVERVLAEGNLQDDFGDFTPPEPAPSEVPGDAPLNELDAAAAEAAEAANAESAAVDAGAPPLDLPAAEAAPDPLAAAEEAPVAQPIEALEGEALVEFSHVPMGEAVVEAVDMDAEAERLKEEGWQVETADGSFEGPEAEPEAAPEPEPLAEETAPEESWAEESDEDGFRYQDWTLYRKDDDGPTPQSIYFFSKGHPEGASAAPVPDGYEVAENPETGRPFLRRMGGDEPGEGPESLEQMGAGAGAQIQPARKRVRVVRVRAGSREEAMAKLQQEGRNVVGSLPIDISRRVQK